MMKIKNLSDDQVFVLPLVNQYNILVSSKYKDSLLICLESYFKDKKKNKAIIRDEENEIILMKDYNFIYFPYSKEIESNFVFKPKSIMNLEISKYIEENPEFFNSIEYIRNDLKGLLTDSGMYKLYSVLGNGLKSIISIHLDDFDISGLLQMLKIDTTKLSESEKYLIIYNLILYSYRNENNIVYIDFPIDDIVINWLKKQRLTNSCFFLDNDAIQTSRFEILESVSFIKLSNYDFLEKIEISKNNLNNLTYIFNSFVIQHLEYQTQKNIDLYNLFYDDSTTFLVNFNDTKTLKRA